MCQFYTYFKLNEKFSLIIEVYLWYIYRIFHKNLKMFSFCKLSFVSIQNKNLIWKVAGDGIIME